MNSPALPENTRLNICLLGPPAVLWQGEKVAIARRKVRAALFYLAGQKMPVLRDRLCLLFWPDLDESGARRNLTRLLTQLRQALPASQALIADADLVSLDKEAVWCDADEFRRRVEGRPREVEDLEQGIRLVRGPFLDGFDLPDCPEFERWCAQERANLEILYLQALASLVEKDTASREYNAAIRYARRYLETDDLAEDVHRNLIRLYALSGDRVKALRQFEDCAAILERELGTSPLPETRAVYQAILQGGLPGSQDELREKYQPAWISQLRLDIPLVGRDSLLLRLEEDLQTATKAHSRVVLISGEPGIGKTRLLHDFAMQHQKGCLLLFGSGDRGEELLPYHPIVEALRGAAHLVPASLSPAWLSELTRLLPEVARLVPDLPPPISLSGEEAHIRLFEALSQFLSALSADFGPVLLCLDNLHWFDRTSLSWLIHFCRQYLVKSKRVLVIGTYLSEDARKVAELRDSLARAGLLDEIRLEGLDQASIRDLLRNLPASEGWAEPFASRLRDATGGNPFFTLEILRALEEEQQTLSGDLSRLVEFPLPQGVRDAIDRRLGRLTPRARQILEAGAVLGSKFGFQAARLTAGRNELETSTGLDELTDRQLTIEEPAGYHFSHDLVRRAALAAIRPHRLQLLHKRAGLTLEKLEPGSAAMLSHLFDLGGEWRKALQYYQKSVQKAEAVYAWQEVLSAYARMMDLLDLLDPQRTNPADLRQRGEILVRVAWLHYQQGERSARDEDLKRLDALIQASRDQPLRLRSMLLQARFLQLEGSYAEALVVVEQGLALAGQLKDTLSRCRLLTQLGTIYYLLGQPSEAISRLEEAERLTEQSQDLGLRALVLARLGFMKGFYGHYQEALEYHRAAYDCYQQLGEPYIAATFLIEIGRWLTCLGRFDESRRSLAEALEIARKAGVHTDEGHALLALGWLDICEGNYEKALLTYRGALDILYMLQNPHLTASSEIAMGVIYYHLGDFSQGRLWLERGLQGGRSIRLKARVAEVLIQLAMLEKADGRLEKARQSLDEGLAKARESGYTEALVAGLALSAGLDRQSGDHTQALLHIEEALGLAAQIDMHAYEMWVLAEAGMILADMGRLEQALDHARRAVLLIPESDQAYMRSEQIYMAYSWVLERAGEAEAAAEQVRLAEAIRQAKADRISDPDLRRTFLAADLVALL